MHADTRGGVVWRVGFVCGRNVCDAVELGAVDGVSSERVSGASERSGRIDEGRSREHVKIVGEWSDVVSMDDDDDNDDFWLSLCVISTTIYTNQ